MTFAGFEEREAMVDIETLSTSPNAHILSIGIVEMGNLKNNLHFKINQNQNRHVDPSTVFWWASQSKEAQAASLNDKGSIQLEVALDMITQWFTTFNMKKIWSHGAPFDVVILENAYRQLDREPPWKFWDVRDTRTLIDLAYRATESKLEPTREGTHHNALDDAIHQARWMNRILEVFSK
jgi:hypothetical protein